VVITGIGAVSPHGLGSAAFWSGLVDGKSSLVPLMCFDASAFDSRVAGLLPPFKTTDYVPKSYRKATKIMARDIELAVVAADLAVRDARLATKSVVEATAPEKIAGWARVDPARVGCNIGAGLICADLNELTAAMVQARNPDGTLSLARWGRSEDPGKTGGMENLTPLWLLKYLPNMLACHVSILHDTQGPSNTITCGQASAGLALGEACRTIQRGSADVALVGGCESKVNPMALMRLSLADQLATHYNDRPAESFRPMDQAADGMVIADGGAVLVIEELEHARERGATIYCEVAGLGAASYPGRLLAAEPDGASIAVAMSKALRDAHVAAAEVQLTVPMGSAAAISDGAYASAIQSVFGAALQQTAVVALRGGIGDCGAGSQALDLAGAALALQQQVLPPAVNCPNPIAGLPVPQVKRAGAIAHALITATSLGGQTAAVVLKKYVA